MPQPLLTLVGVVTSLTDSETGVEKPGGKRGVAIETGRKEH